MFRWRCQCQLWTLIKAQSLFRAGWQETSAFPLALSDKSWKAGWCRTWVWKDGRTGTTHQPKFILGGVGGEDWNSRALWTASWEAQGRAGWGVGTVIGQYLLCGMGFPSGPTPHPPKHYGAGFRQMRSGMGLLLLLISCEVGSNELPALPLSGQGGQNGYLDIRRQWMAAFLGVQVGHSSRFPPSFAFYAMVLSTSNFPFPCRPHLCQ